MTTLDLRTSLLLEKYSPVARSVAGYYKRRVPRSVLMEDLLAAAMSGLWDAIRLNSNTECETFPWYVRVRIKGAVLDELRSQDWLPRRFRSSVKEGDKAPFHVSIEDLPRDTDYYHQFSAATDVEDEAYRRSWTGILTRSMDEVLSPKEKHIVTDHYFRGRKFKEMGDELGVSEPRISQIHARAMVKLRAVVPRDLL